MAINDSYHTPLSIQKSALLKLFAAYAFGILSAPFFQPPPDRIILLTVFSLMAGYLWLRKLRALCLILAMIFAGFTLYHLDLAVPTNSRHVVHFAEGEKIIEGWVENLSSKPQGSVLTLEADRVFSHDTAISVTGKVLLFIRAGYPEIVRPGDRVRVMARLRRPTRYGTPGEFDYPRHLAGKGIYVTGALPAATGIVKLAGHKRQSLQDAIENLRHDIRLFIEESSPQETAPFLRALTIGDRRGLSPEEKKLLGFGGVSHLFAISGLHMGILFLIFYSFLKYLYCRFTFLLYLAPPRKVVPLAITPLLFLYLLLAGGGPPTQRAFLALFFAAILLLLGRYTSPLRILLAVAFFILLLDPPALFAPSYQLSFAAVSAILCFAPRWQRRILVLPKPCQYVIGLFLLTLTATFATLPLVLLHFHVFSPAGLLINLAAVPMVTFFALPCALAGVASFLFVPSLGTFFFRASGLFLDWTLTIVRTLTTVFDSESGLYFLTPFEITALGILFLGAVLWTNYPAWQYKIFATTLILCGSLVSIPSLFNEAFMLTAVNVGHGDALVIKKNEKTYLVDGGGAYSETFDVGERILAPALGWMGERQLEAVILSHTHPDHYKGLAFILRHFHVNAFWSAVATENLPPIIREPLAQNNIPTIRFSEGWTLVESEPDSEFLIFVPDQQTPLVNDRSLVVYMREQGNSLLLTGDLETEGVEKLIDSFTGIPVNLLKLPHHGSPYSTPELLLDFFQPQTVFATAVSLPSKTIARLSDVKSCRIYPLSTEGSPASARFIATKRGWDVGYWQQGLFR